MGKFPNSHGAFIGLIATVLGIIAALNLNSGDPAHDRFTTEIVLDGIEPAAPADESPADVTVAAVAEADPAARPVPDVTTRVERVRPGDSLAVIFKRLDIPARELQRILDSGPLADRLKSIFPGHELTFGVDDVGTLVRFTYSPGPLETLAFERVGDAFVNEQLIQEPEEVTTHRHATIEHSLFVSSQRIGLNDEITLRLAQIFQWDIDFVLDIRKGDEFYVLFNERYLGDEFIGYGAILAAEFVNQGQRYRAVRYIDSAGDIGYYNPEGRNMRKAFLRAPVEFSRISSNFNLKRVHPLFKRSMPHRGIDYVAPTGTPVLAAGDGKVRTASRTKANGRYIVLQHGEQFQTKYLHLSKFGRGVKQGKRVEQGQIIGYVGSTGWATGPHLHYEFLVNGVHKNPRTVKLPAARPIPKSERERFENHAEPLLTLLDSYRQEQQLAFAR